MNCRKILQGARHTVVPDFPVHGAPYAVRLAVLAALVSALFLIISLCSSHEVRGGRVGFEIEKSEFAVEGRTESSYSTGFSITNRDSYEWLNLSLGLEPREPFWDGRHLGAALSFNGTEYAPYHVVNLSLEPGETLDGFLVNFSISKLAAAGTYQVRIVSTDEDRETSYDLETIIIVVQPAAGVSMEIIGAGAGDESDHYFLNGEAGEPIGFRASIRNEGNFPDTYTLELCMNEERLSSKVYVEIGNETGPVSQFDLENAGEGNTTEFQVKFYAPFDWYGDYILAMRVAGRTLYSALPPSYAEAILHLSIDLKHSIQVTPETPVVTCLDGKPLLYWPLLPIEEVRGYRIYREGEGTGPVLVGETYIPCNPYINGSTMSGSMLNGGWTFHDTSASNDTGYEYRISAVYREDDESSLSRPALYEPVNRGGGPTDSDDSMTLVEKICGMGLLVVLGLLFVMLYYTAMKEMDGGFKRRERYLGMAHEIRERIGTGQVMVSPGRGPGETGSAALPGLRSPPSWVEDKTAPAPGIEIYGKGPEGISETEPEECEKRPDDRFEMEPETYGKGPEGISETEHGEYEKQPDDRFEMEPETYGKGPEGISETEHGEHEKRPDDRFEIELGEHEKQPDDRFEIESGEHEKQPDDRFEIEPGTYGKRLDEISKEETISFEAGVFPISTPCSGCGQILQFYSPGHFVCPKCGSSHRVENDGEVYGEVEVYGESVPEESGTGFPRDAAWSWEIDEEVPVREESGEAGECVICKKENPDYRHTCGLYFHRDCLDHYMEFVHDGEKGRCPFCGELIEKF